MSRCHSIGHQLIGVGLVALLLGACGLEGRDRAEVEQEEPGLKIEHREWRFPPGHALENEDVRLFELSNGSMKVALSNYGGLIVALEVPDAEGQMADVVLGHDRPEKYVNGYFGAVVGRYANRIAKGRFTLDGETYELATNNGPNSLHGGEVGFDSVVWDWRLIGEPTDTVSDPGAVGVELTYVSVDGEEGYPGTLTATVRYTLGQANELHIDAKATTDEPTVCNLAFHSYFNLRGEGDGDILGHEVELFASAYTPVDETLIPTGDIAPVEGTPMDFLTPRAIGERIDNDFEQLVFGSGYDHNWVIDGQPSTSALALAARARDPESGRVLEVLTSEPGVQFYAGNFLDGSDIGKGGKPYPRRSGFCLETQHFPDSPNQPGFPSTVLRPGETYRHVTVYRFSADARGR